MRRSSPWLVPVCLVSAGMLAVLIRDIRHVPDGRVHVHILDVGQGSAALITDPTGRRVVVDGGPDFSALDELGGLLPVLDRRIDLVVLSHPDLDHIVALPELLRRYDVHGVLLTGVDKATPRYETLLHEVMDRGIPVMFPDPGTDIELGNGVMLDVVWPRPSIFGTQPEHVNDTSVVLRVLFGKTSVLLPGDIGEGAEREILQGGADLQSDVLVAGHHGSRTSTSTGFLLAVGPEYAVISAGKENPFGHPHPSVLKRFAASGIPVIRTDRDGTVHVVLDGKTVHIAGRAEARKTASRW